MRQTTPCFVGLDVHKESIAVATSPTMASVKDTTCKVAVRFALTKYRPPASPWSGRYAPFPKKALHFAVGSDSKDYTREVEWPANRLASTPGFLCAGGNSSGRLRSTAVFPAQRQHNRQDRLEEQSDRPHDRRPPKELAITCDQEPAHQPSAGVSAQLAEIPQRSEQGR